MNVEDFKAACRSIAVETVGLEPKEGTAFVVLWLDKDETLHTYVRGNSNMNTYTIMAKRLMMNLMERAAAKKAAPHIS